MIDHIAKCLMYLKVNMYARVYRRRSCGKVVFGFGYPSGRQRKSYPLVTLLSTTTTTTTATPPLAFPSATILAAIAWLSLPMVVGITRSKVIVMFEL